MLCSSVFVEEMIPVVWHGQKSKSKRKGGGVTQLKMDLCGSWCSAVMSMAVSPDACDYLRFLVHPNVTT